MTNDQGRMTLFKLPESKLTMVQSHLLQLAKQGDPAAIAALMNQTLEPKGIVTKAVLINHCLNISFISSRPLNASTLVNFTREGLRRLHLASVQTVLVAAFRDERESPLWSQQFSMDTAPEGATIPERVTAGVAGKSAAANALENARSLRSSIAASSQPPSSQPKASEPPTPEPAAPKDALRKGAPKTAALKATEKMSQFAFLLRFGYAKYLIASSLLALTAFLSGGVLAFLTNAAANGLSDPIFSRLSPFGARVETSDSGALAAQATLSKETYQAQAKQYLARMNQAQQDFYRQNGRLTDNLEELERSASIISQSQHYSYRLAMLDDGRSQLIAVAKTDGLKSYTAGFVVSNASTAPATLAIICETNQPKKVPPKMPRAAAGSLQCPAGSSRSSM